MRIPFTDKYKPKDFSFVFGSGWEKGDFKMIEYRKTPLGWDFNLWRFSFSYDDWAKVKPRQ